MAVRGLLDGVSAVDLLSFARHRVQLGRVLIGAFILYPGDEVIGELRARVCVCVCVVGAAGGSRRVRVAPQRWEPAGPQTWVAAPEGSGQGSGTIIIQAERPVGMREQAPHGDGCSVEVRDRSIFASLCFEAAMRGAWN